MEVEENGIKMCKPCTDICPKGRLWFSRNFLESSLHRVLFWHELPFKTVL